MEKPSSKQPNLEILIVDDDPIIRMMHKKRIQNAGLPHPVILCKDGKEAVQHLETGPSSGETAYLVLLDLNMPVMNGWEFLEECQKKFQQLSLHVVVVTSSINQEDHHRASNYQNVIVFCEKPLSPQSLEKITRLKQLKNLL